MIVKRFLYGGPGGDRTLDLRVANAALSQLSYEPISRIILYHIIYEKSIGRRKFFRNF